MPFREVFNEENFKKIIEFAPIGIVIIDSQYKWLLVNQRFCDLTGYDRAELVDKTFLDLTHPDDINHNIDLYQSMIHGDHDEYIYEKRYVRKDGRVIWVKLNVSGVRIEGEYSHMIALIQDIDESKKYRENLESKNAELDTLFYKISHDLKSPITTLKGLCQILKMENEKIESKETFQHLEKAIVQLQKQNNSLVQLTKVFEHSISESDFLLEQLLKFSVNEKETVFKTRDLGVKINSDPFLVKLMIENIIYNALQFKSLERELEIKVGYQSLPGQHVISIEDNGVGIESESLSHIFKMFYKANELVSGGGLGLYIVKIAAERIQATIEVKSEVGRGTTFNILLPK
jgi:PAS domain S-box-containing protein